MHDPPVFPGSRTPRRSAHCGFGPARGKRSPASCVACVSPGADIEGLTIATPGTNRLAAFGMRKFRCGPVAKLRDNSDNLGDSSPVDMSHQGPLLPHQTCHPAHACNTPHLGLGWDADDEPRLSMSSVRTSCPASPCLMPALCAYLARDKCRVTRNATRIPVRLARWQGWSQFACFASFWKPMGYPGKATVTRPSSCFVVSSQGCGAVLPPLHCPRTAGVQGCQRKAALWVGEEASREKQMAVEGCPNGDEISVWNPTDCRLSKALPG
ncbi:hypothetical protein F5144DRAFT_327841 [Chaetomium tenue]|uniref:Uncharacterized protein n=1 Tax=Chaetomium tenue TaxID=1854479 RepID=A0ACB7P5B1_9PEZI|nr:hypothetical protein F5144DRAFT_327841 [Chaetomium globosum]